MSLRHTISFFDHRGVKIKTKPTVEPVTADELRSQLGVTSDVLSDADANALVEEAREWIETEFGIAFNNQVWTLTLDNWPAAQEQWWDGVRQSHINTIYTQSQLIDIGLPRWPLQSVDSVKVYDEDSNETVVTIASTFDVDLFSKPGRMSLQRGATWPIATRANNAVIIEFSAGYGAASTDVPAPLRRAVKQLAAYLFEHRGDGCTVGDAMHGSGAGPILDQYRVRRV